MHGTYYAVAASDPVRHAITIASMSGFPFVNEDVLIFYGGDTEVKSSAVIGGSHSVDQPDSTVGMTSKNLLYNDKFTYDDCDFLEVVAARLTFSLLKHQIPYWSSFYIGDTGRSSFSSASVTPANSRQAENAAVSRKPFWLPSPLAYAQYTMLCREGHTCM